MEFFAVSPRLQEPAQFLKAFDQTLTLAEAYGLRGILLFEGGRVPFSPWVLAQHLLARSQSLMPLIAVGPAYASSGDAARLIVNLEYLYGRPVAINLVAGAEAQAGSHAERYQGLRQFSLTLDADLARLRAGQPIGPGAPGHPDRKPAAMRFVAGHSADAAELAAHIGASNLRMLPSTLAAGVPAGCGLNFGVVTRPTSAAAWAAATELFPEQPGAARVARRVASRTDSEWKAETLAEAAGAPGYWRHPAQSLKADSPFYVGSYQELARLFASCRDAAVSALLLDLPPSEAEYAHFSRASQLSRHLAAHGA